MSAEQELIATYANMQDGTSISGQLCPKCTGGNSGERSLSVSVDGLTLKWMCHRASCGWHGMTLVVGGGGSRSAPVNRHQKPPLSFKEHSLSQDQYSMLRDKYGLDKGTCDAFSLGWTPDLTSYPEGRIIIPIHTYDNGTGGWVLRGINKQEKQKALIVKARDTMGMCWFHARGGDASQVMIVEDCYSALRASKYMNSVALLGTYLSPETVDDLVSLKLSRYFLALDKDAFNKSVEYAFKYKSKLKLEPVALPKDVKNLTEPELCDLIEELYEDE